MSAHVRMRRDSAEIPKQDRAHSDLRKVHVANGEVLCQGSFLPSSMWSCTPGIPVPSQRVWKLMLPQ